MPKGWRNWFRRVSKKKGGDWELYDLNQCLDRKGHLIDYQPPCPVSRIGSAAPSLKKLMKTHATPTIVMYQSSKRKAVQGTTQKAVTRKRLRRTRSSTTQVNNAYSSQTDIQLLIPFLHSYQTLRPNLLWVRNCCPRHLI